MSILFWVIAASFGLRVIGVLFGLPQLTHQDEPIVVNHALAYANFDLNPHFFKIPPLLSYLVFGVYGFCYLVLHVIMGVSRDEFAVSFFRDPVFFYATARVIFGVALGTASVLVLYRFAKKMWGNTAALSAALFFAVNFLHARDSHYVYADIPMIFAMLMACMALSEGPAGVRRASVWSGIAVAFKYIAAPILLPVYAVAFAVKGKDRFQSFITISFLSFVVYLALNPFSLIDGRFFLSEILHQAKSESPMPFFHHASYSLLEGSGVGLLGLAVVGAALIILRGQGKRWTLLFPATYYLLLWRFSQPYERYVMPMVPFLCLFAGVAVDSASNVVKGPKGRTVVIAALILAAGAEPFFKSVYLDRLLLEKDTRQEARQWVLENVPSGASIVVQHAFFSPKIEQTPDQVRGKAGRIAERDPHRAEKEKKIRYLLRAQEGSKTYSVHYLTEHMSSDAPFMTWSPMIEPDVGALRREGARYFIRYRQSGESAFFEKELLPKARLMAVFSPYNDPAKKFTQDEWANTGLPYRSRELFSRNRPGPYLEIYELDLK